MKYYLETTYSKTGNVVFYKERTGKDYYYLAVDENGYSQPVSKQWILKNKSNMLNVGFSKEQIYYVDPKKDQHSSNREWIISIYKGMFPEGAENINVDYNKSGQQRWIFTGGSKKLMVAEYLQTVKIMAADNEQTFIDMSVQGNFDSLHLSFKDFPIKPARKQTSNSSSNSLSFGKTVEEPIVRVARVVFEKQGKEYCYLCGDLDVRKGQEVWVGVGAYGHETKGYVTKIEEYEEDQMPYYDLKEILNILG